MKLKLDEEIRELLSAKLSKRGDELLLLDTQIKKLQEKKKKAFDACERIINILEIEDLDES